MEAALAEALTDASGARRFDVVILLVKELEARRLERISRVVPVGPVIRGRPKVTR